jgi:hypothetical protein
MNKVYKTSHSGYCTPSSEPFGAKNDSDSKIEKLIIFCANSIFAGSSAVETKKNYTSELLDYGYIII